MVQDLKGNVEQYQKEAEMDFFGLTMLFYVRKTGESLHIIMTVKLEDQEVLWDRFDCRDEMDYCSLKEELEVTKKELLYNFISFHKSIQNFESWLDPEDLPVPLTRSGLHGIEVGELFKEDD